MTEYIVNPDDEHLFYGDMYVKLIRCEDCKYFYENRWCIRYLKTFLPDDYCSYAVQKEGEAE